jgi:hypothetical protein
VGGVHRLTDGLTYRDLAGRRRLRRYVLASIAIFALIGAIVWLGRRQSSQLLAPGEGAPTAVRTARLLAGVAPAPTASGVAPAGTHSSFNIASSPEPPTPVISSTQTSIPSACPGEPKRWELVEIAQSDNFKRIAPPCVYVGLSRTVAWDLLRAMGYGAREAADALGLAELPWRPMRAITGMTELRGPMSIELEYAGPEVEKQLMNLDFHTWIIDSQGNPGVAFTLRGCYRTETVQGGQVKSWGVGYAVICVVSVDQMDRALLELGPHRYIEQLTPLRQFTMYGYAGGGLWVGLGYQKGPRVAIRLPGSVDLALLPLTMDLEQIVQDQKLAAGQHGLVPWDAAWLAQTFGLAMHSLPENWQSFNDPAELQAIQAGANSVFERREAP